MSISAPKARNAACAMAVAFLVVFPVTGLRADAGISSEDENGTRLLDASATLCIGLDNKNADPLALRNWEEYDPRADEPLSEMLAYWKRGAELQNAELTRYQLQKGMIGQRNAYILITALEGWGGVKASSCRVLIPGDKVLISSTALEVWSGKKPTQFFIPVQVNETRLGVTSPRDGSFDISTSFIDPAIAVPARAKTKTLPFHGTIIQFGTSENTKL